MVKTGYISFVVEGGGGKDTDGNFIPATKTPTSFVECNLAVIKKEYKFYVDGQWRVSKYSIYIDNSKIPAGIDITNITEVVLQDNRGNDLGTHQIHNIEYLEIMKQTKIIV